MRNMTPWFSFSKAKEGKYESFLTHNPLLTTKETENKKIKKKMGLVNAFPGSQITMKLQGKDRKKVELFHNPADCLM